ncbi:hypothetical protein, partial [Paenibacillus sp. 2TAB19]|uniref:hypothetical protein n=1 Tax=Paenibacillus sp. 2TAB19 TaxID=3233003 RepID=UPI003F9D6852
GLYFIRETFACAAQRRRQPFTLAFLMKRTCSYESYKRVFWLWQMGHAAVTSGIPCLMRGSGYPHTRA